jgi:hypothetical protein
MSGPKRNPDRLNTIGVVVVGVCGAVLVYVTIVALEAFYVNDTSEIQTMRDYGGQDTAAQTLRADQLKNLADHNEPNGIAPGAPQTYRIPIDVAMKLVTRDAKTDPSHLTGSATPPADKQTVPVPGTAAAAVPAPTPAPTPTPTPTPTPNPAVTPAPAPTAPPPATGSAAGGHAP